MGKFLLQPPSLLFIASKVIKILSSENRRLGLFKVLQSLEQWRGVISNPAKGPMMSIKIDPNSRFPVELALLAN